MKTPLSKNPLLKRILLERYKMNEIVNNVLLAGNKFIPEMYLRQPGFTYIVYGPSIKTKERLRKFKVTGDSRYIYQTN